MTNATLTRLIHAGLLLTAVLLAAGGSGVLPIWPPALMLICLATLVCSTLAFELLCARASLPTLRTDVRDARRMAKDDEARRDDDDEL